LCHYDSFWVAEIDGYPQAALSTFEYSAGGWATVAEAQSAVRRDLGWTEKDLEASGNRMAPLWACFLPDVGADWGIENIATKPESRRLGLVSVLLDQAIREGRERGCKLLQTTTYIGNSAVHAALAKAGFQVSEEKRSEVTMTALGTPGFVRFLRVLS
jgi:GNAT superfamily N-acetyltransferase